MKTTRKSSTKKKIADILNAKFQQNHRYFVDDGKKGKEKRTHNADESEKINSAQNSEKCLILFVAFKEKAKMKIIQYKSLHNNRHRRKSEEGKLWEIKARI